MITGKKSQGEIITTVLLILVGIAAVVIVSTFVINMVRENLVSTDCFKTSGQLKINSDNLYTWFNNNTKIVSINIERGASTEFNLTAIQVVLGNGGESRSYTIKSSGGSNEVKMASSADAPIVIPNPSETRTYHINVTAIGFASVTEAKLVPIIAPDKSCNEGSAESKIPAQVV